MKYSIACWNFNEPGITLLQLVQDFLAVGFDTISFLPRQFLDLTAEQRRNVQAFLRGRNASVTLHGKADMPPADATALVELLGDSIASFTFDAVMSSDSGGSSYDSAMIARLLGEVRTASEGTAMRFGIEDFPLDAAAVDRYRADLSGLLQCPRYGMLIDVGHMNLRRNHSGYFHDLSIEDYFRRARAAAPIVEVHLHDNSGLRDEHQRLGAGTIVFSQVAKALKDVGFDGVSTIEIAPALHGNTPAQDRPRVLESLQRWQRLWEAEEAR